MPSGSQPRPLAGASRERSDGTMPATNRTQRSARMVRVAALAGVVLILGAFALAARSREQTKLTPAKSTITAPPLCVVGTPGCGPLPKLTTHHTAISPGSPARTAPARPASAWDIQHPRLEHRRIPPRLHCPERVELERPIPHQRKRCRLLLHRPRAGVRRSMSLGASPTQARTLEPRVGRGRPRRPTDATRNPTQSDLVVSQPARAASAFGARLRSG